MPRERNPVSKTLRCLELILEAENSEIGVRELAESMHVSPSSAHRILNGLVDEGYVTRDPVTQRYRIGVGFLRLAYLSADRIPIRKLAMAAMQELAEEHNETVLLGLYDSTRREMVFVASIESTHPLRYAVRLNQWSPIHTGATGLAILAFLPEQECEAILSGPLERLTPETITDPNRLRSVLEQVRRQGYALTHGQRITGAVGIAAPIFSGTGAVIGDVSVTIPEQRFVEDLQEKLIAAVRATADKITRLTGGASAERSRAAS
ncbi:IclR family transcriptional regulator [Propylenella binzhouense]|uniref:IclR family transcriptional regulator n=1 Tax=Propylenella binzhouense TaxID=2555902 RepID=A0A964T0W1_9HYPH|nr:IclR family transcriptional regulator [Propylenella binzhouense]MYZ46358.1 IclR family transcriptional regulator [Propylenella binzhouense]